MFEEDPTCDFVILEHEKTGEMVAAGNRRFMDEAGESVWIEAIRVSTRFKRRGIATLFMQELCRMSKEGGALEILSCTIDTNDAQMDQLHLHAFSPLPCVRRNGSLLWSSRTSA